MAQFVLRLISSKMIHLITTTKLPVTLNISKNMQTEISQKFKTNLAVTSNEEQKEVIVLKEKEAPKSEENRDKLSVKIKLENGVVKTLDLVQVPSSNVNSTTANIKLRKETSSIGNKEMLTYSKEEVKYNIPEISEHKDATKPKTILSNRSYCYGIPSSFGTWFRIFNTSKQIVNKNYAAFDDYSPNKTPVSPVSDVPTVNDIMRDLKPGEYNSNVNKNYIKLESTDDFLNYKCE